MTDRPFRDPLQAALDGLRQAKHEIALTDEMSRRAGLDIETGRRLLAVAKAHGKRSQDLMEAVAWAIHNTAAGRK